MRSRLRGLREAIAAFVLRRPVSSTFAVAIAVRVAVAVTAVLVRTEPLVPDERQYIGLATAVADGRGAAGYFGEYGEHLYAWTFAYTGLLARIFEIVPPSRIWGALVSAFFGALCAAITVVIARRVVTTRYALAAGAVVALMPSQIVWSSTAIREAMVWGGIACAALVIPVIGTTTRGRTLTAIALGVGGLLALGWLRDQTLVAAAWALALAGVFAPRPRRLVRAAVALTIATVVPLVAGLGALGLGYVGDTAGHLGQRRTELSVNAESGFIDLGATDPSTVDDGDSREIIEHGSRTFAVDESVGANVRQVPRGLVAALVRPLPTDRGGGVAFKLAKVENLLWVVLYALALIALPDIWRRRDVLGYPCAVIITIIGIASVSQGNVGTAFRHRAQILWALAILAAVGAGRLRRQLIDR